MFKVSIIDFTFNLENCAKGVRGHDIHPSLYAINIQRIQLKLPIDSEDLKTLKPGQDLDFKIDQTLRFIDPEDNKKDSFDADGVGSGTISSMDSYEEDGIIHVDIELEDGYAEEL